MEKNKKDQLIITKKVMEEDPTFASFSDVSSTAESDNTLNTKRPVVALGELSTWYWVWVDHRLLKHNTTCNAIQLFE